MAGPTTTEETPWTRPRSKTTSKGFKRKKKEQVANRALPLRYSDLERMQLWSAHNQDPGEFCWANFLSC
jgi:hypothetical protein